MHDPIALFSQWFDEAQNHSLVEDASVMTLATASAKGMPSVRVVLLKGFDEQGFVFFTNMESRKSLELKENPCAALCFFWPPLGKQVRVEGKVTTVSGAEADAYYATRPLISRLGAIVSKQSRPLASRDALMAKVQELQECYSETNPPPRPDNWSGWRLAPEAIEFWQAGEYRLHDRNLYTRDHGGWKVQRLYP